MNSREEGGLRIFKKRIELSHHAAAEDLNTVDAIFFDANNDRWPDLLVVNVDGVNKLILSQYDEKVVIVVVPRQIC